MIVKTFHSYVNLSHYDYFSFEAKQDGFYLSVCRDTDDVDCFFLFDPEDEPAFEMIEALEEMIEISLCADDALCNLTEVGESK